jgi:type IV pilus assembly protein PilW
VKADWVSAIVHHVQAYDNGATPPTCVGADLKPNTDILVVRRVSTCEAGAAGCLAAAAGKPYIQVARCATEVAVPANYYEVGLSGTQPFLRHARNCTTVAGLRQYFVRIYYISTDNGSGSAIPTLKRVEMNDTSTGWVTTPMVEGIDQLQFEYGIDTDGDGDPDGYTADPNNFNPAGCVGCTAVNNWANVMTVRIHLLARNIEPSVNYTDPKTYTLGRDAAGSVISVIPADAYRRHAYHSLVRIVNAAERRDTP